MPRELLTTAPSPSSRKAAAVSAAVPPCAPKPGTRKSTSGSSRRSAASSAGLVAPDDRADIAEATLSQVLACPGPDGLGDVEEQGPAAAVEVLELPAPGLLVRTRTNTPRAERRALCRNGSSASRPR